MKGELQVKKKKLVKELREIRLLLERMLECQESMQEIPCISSSVVNVCSKEKEGSLKEAPQMQCFNGNKDNLNQVPTKEEMQKFVFQKIEEGSQRALEVIKETYKKGITY